MKLFTAAQKKKLLANGARLEREMNGEYIDNSDMKPIVRLFHPATNAVWLIAAIYPTGFNEELAYGLCDIGMGCAELGDVPLVDPDGYGLDSFVIHGIGVERDLCFKATKTLGEYSKEARKLGRIAA